MERLLLTALLLTAFGAPAVHAQSPIPDDLALIDNLYRGDFDAIDRDQDTLINLLMISSSFGDLHCYAEPTDDPEVLAASARAAQFVFSLDVGITAAARLASLSPRTNPQLTRVGVWLQEHDCGSEQTQQLFQNYTRLLASRNTAAAWGLGG
ncbi:MAG TPA: hypothetical protein VFG50_16580 [Rhodothermales bacterium]|nr:hypothetical protein [Rhodothermales bacterium]